MGSLMLGSLGSAGVSKVSQTRATKEELSKITRRNFKGSGRGKRGQII